MNVIRNLLSIILSISLLSLLACSSPDGHEAMLSVEQTARSMTNEVLSEEMIYEETMAAQPENDERLSPVNYISTKAASPINDGDKKFIRKANLGFKVGNVISATHAIEDIIIQKKGFIIESTIKDNSLYSYETRVSKDSILVRTRSNLVGTLILRVPYATLDEALREIAPLAELIKHRVVEAEDITFDILANKLEQDRKKDKSQRIKSISGNNKEHKLEDLLAAEEAIDIARQQADAALIADYKLKDNVEYSTITVHLEQEAKKFAKMKAVEKEIEVYSIGIFKKFTNAITSGWNGLLDGIVGLIAIWPVLLIGAAIAWGIVAYRKKKKKAVK